MPQTLISFMGAIEAPMFSDYLSKLHGCEDPDETYTLLMRAYKAEPYLLAKLVNLANSVMYGYPGRYFYTPEECLGRVGMAQATRLAMAFFVEAGLKGWLYSCTRSRAVWQEAVFASQIAEQLRLDTGLLLQNSAFLATLLSYLGELFLAGPVFERLGDEVHLGLYAHSQSNEIDPYILTKLLLKKLTLPQPIEASLGLVERFFDPSGNDPHHRVAAALTLARGVAQRFYPRGVFIAYVEDNAVEYAQLRLGLDDKGLEALIDKAKLLRKDLPLYLTS